MDLDALSQRLGIKVEPQLLEQALTHRSYAYEQGGIPNNERLEFLGDSVLGFVVTEHIFETLTNLSEGELTKIKNAVVSERALAYVANELGLGEFLRLGKGEENSGGRNKASILADAVEAILGAVLISQGLPEAKRLVEKLIFPLLADPDAVRQAADPKTSVDEIAHQRDLGAVAYVVTHEGPDHDRNFFANLFIGEELYASADGRTKRAAESAAAAIALAKLKAE